MQDDTQEVNKEALLVHFQDFLISEKGGWSLRRVAFDMGDVPTTPDPNTLRAWEKYDFR